MAKPLASHMPKKLAGNEFLEGGGECGALIRAKDWSKTPLGPPQKWPQSLKTAVRIILTSRQPMFVWWGKQLINLYNDPYQAIVGGKHPDALGQPAQEVWHEIWDQVGPRAKTAISRNVGTYDEALLLIMQRHGYAEETYYTFSYSPIPGDNGEPAGIICANSDDTQRIIGERQMTLLRDLAAITSTARSAKEVCKLSAQALQTNPQDIPFAMVYLYDRGHEQLSLTSLAGITKDHPAVSKKVVFDRPDPWLLDKAIQTNQPQYIDNVHAVFDDLPTGAWERPPFGAAIVPIGRQGPDSKSGALIVGLNPYRLYDGSYKDFIKLMVGEISASIANAEAYAEERKRAESLSELDRVKTSFFSNVSHEFRTPLTLMMGPLEDLLRSPGMPPPSSDTQSQLEVMYRNGLRLQKLVNALLDFSRIEAGRVQAVFTPTELGDLTADLASNFRSAVEKAGMKLIVRTPKSVTSHQKAYVDKEMWEKIVLNLVSNAFKYSLRGSITVEVKEQPESFELRVKDTGIGIRKKDLPRLFERFHRVQGVVARTNEGTGIGLSLVSELVKLHKGTLSVQSTFGKGTTFLAIIPKGFSHLSSDQVAHDDISRATTISEQYIQEASRWQLDEVLGQRQPLDSLSVQAQKRYQSESDTLLPWIILADDNADMREYVTRLLRQYYRVTPVADGQAALELVRDNPPDLLVTDVMMQRLDGFGLLKALREDPKTSTIPVILLSARAGEEAHIEGLAAGADDYLVKPFGARELLARVNAHLEMARLRKEAALGMHQERQKLAESEQRLRFMAESMPQMIFTVQPNGTLDYFSPQWYEYTGQPAGTLEKSSKERYRPVHPDDIKAVKKTWDWSFKHGQPLEHEYRLLRYDGAYRWHICRVKPQQDSDGKIILWVGSATDIDDMRRATERRHELEVKTAALTEQRTQLLALNQAKDEFISLASHQLRTPATGVKQYIGMLLQGYAGDITDDQRTFLQTAYESNERQITIVNDLLQVARIDAGKITLHTELADMVRIVKNVLNEHASSLAERDQKVAVSFEKPHMPVPVDADRIRMVIDNIIDNASKYTESGKTIRVSLRSTSKALLLVVKDQGVGIEPGDIDKIFQKFSRLDNPLSNASEGSGLGLYWAKKIVDLHEGSIVIRSQVSKGTSVTIRLPL